jgi:hypothetical protein
VSLDAHLELAIADPLFMEINAGLGVPVIRHRFQIEVPGESPREVHQVPWVSGHGGFSLGARFP